MRGREGEREIEIDREREIGVNSPFLNRRKLLVCQYYCEKHFRSLSIYCVCYIHTFVVRKHQDHIAYCYARILCTHPYAWIFNMGLEEKFYHTLYKYQFLLLKYNICYMYKKYTYIVPESTAVTQPSALPAKDPFSSLLKYVLSIHAY